jgi:hypothetical protein
MINIPYVRFYPIYDDLLSYNLTWPMIMGIDDLVCLPVSGLVGRFGDLAHPSRQTLPRRSVVDLI